MKNKIKVGDVVLVESNYSWGQALVVVTEVCRGYFLAFTLDAENKKDTDLENRRNGPCNSAEDSHGWAYGDELIVSVVEAA